MINTLNVNSGINSIYGSSASQLLSKVTGDNSGNKVDLFKSAFESAANALREVDSMQAESNNATVKFITGEDDNIHSVMLAQEKALMALQFTSEVTNKALEAYNEIMKMQI